jgi:hypothetical protein
MDFAYVAKLWTSQRDFGTHVTHSRWGISNLWMQGGLGLNVMKLKKKIVHLLNTSVRLVAGEQSISTPPGHSCF